MTYTPDQTDQKILNHILGPDSPFIIMILLICQHLNILLPLYLFFTWFHIHVNGLYVRVVQDCTHSSINLFIKGRITRFQYISKTVKEFVCYKPLVVVFRIELQQGSQEETKFCFILIPLLVLPLLIFNMPVFCA